MNVGALSARRQAVCYHVPRRPMQRARILSGLVVLPIALFALTPSRLAHAQETTLDPLRAAANAAAALVLGRALRRAGHEQDALFELRRGFSTPGGRTGDVAIGLHWEIART